MIVTRFASMALVMVFLAWSALAWASEPMRLPVDPDPIVFETMDGEVAFDLEVADEADERSRGLMHRTDLPADRGMIFVYRGDNRISMWMANTPQSLDMVFIGATGRVTAVVADTEPFSRAVISPPVLSRFVVEFNAGTAAAKGIVPGIRARHRLIGVTGQ